MTELSPIHSVRNRKGIPGIVKTTVYVDMTPMTDLGFLLVSFFILTTEISRPVVIKLSMPPDKGATDIAASKSMTILLRDDDKIFYYSGDFAGNAHHNVIAISSNKIGHLIQARQQNLEARGINRNELMLLIKPIGATSYESIIALLDELLKNDVSRYAFADPTPLEIQSSINR